MSTGAFVDSQQADPTSNTALTSQVAALQRSAGRLRRALIDMARFFSAAPDADPLPRLHDLARELLHADELQITVPAGVSRAALDDDCVLQSPVIIAGRPMGRIDARRAQPFDNDDKALAQAAGHIIGLVLEQSSLFSQFAQYREQAQANADTLDQLLIFGRRIASGMVDQQQLAVHLATQVLDMVGGERASLLLTPIDQPERPVLVLNSGMVATTERAIQVRDNGFAGLVLRERKPLIVDETDTDQRWLALGFYEKDSPTRCAMAVPLVWGEQTLGALTVTTTRSRLFNTPQLNLLELIACHVTLALRSADLDARLAGMAALLSDINHRLNGALQVAQFSLQLLAPAHQTEEQVLVSVDDLAKIGMALERIGEVGRQLHAARLSIQGIVGPPPRE